MPPCHHAAMSPCHRTSRHWLACVLTRAHSHIRVHMLARCQRRRRTARFNEKVHISYGNILVMALKRPVQFWGPPFGWIQALWHRSPVALVNKICTEPSQTSTFLIVALLRLFVVCCVQSAMWDLWLGLRWKKIGLNVCLVAPVVRDARRGACDSVSNGFGFRFGSGVLSAFVAREARRAFCDSGFVVGNGHSWPWPWPIKKCVRNRITDDVQKKRVVINVGCLLYMSPTV